MKYKVGYLFTDKKIKSSGLVLKSLELALKERSIEWIRIELEAIPDGLDAIVHKITDLLVSETENDLLLSQVSCGGVISVLNNYLERFPKCILIEPFEALEKLLTRKSMLQAFVRVCCEFSSSAEQSKYEFCAPVYQVLNADALQSIQDKIFPAIVKNNTACALSKSHVMYAVSGREDVDKLKRFVGRDEDVVAQRFVPHYGIILKVYVLDDHFFISLRPSIEQAVEFISFNSQDLRKDFNPDELFSEKYQQVEALINDLNFKSTLKRFISRIWSFVKIQAD
ncbi:hypothetical protein MP638_000939 [Amoeboaphelidium occidentale]|nr:hypothetical protein MP638_000939 [Amoeboaphelidium occidentale]